jgi:hypothetical protein
MKYLCLIYEDRVAGKTLPQAEIQKAMKEYGAFEDSVKQSGHYLGSNALKDTSAAKTVRVRNGKISATDGPFVETKEQLGGYYLIEAKDWDDAIKIAGRIPSAKWGAVEVRPIHEYERA